MATTMSREEVRRIAWRVSILGVERALTTSGTSSGVLLRDHRRGREATRAARFEAGRDGALAADECGRDPRREALDVRRPADRQRGAARAAELGSEHTVEGCLEGECLLLAAPCETSTHELERRLLPGLEHVLLDRGESGCVGGEHRVVAPRGLRQAELRL